MVNGFWKIPWKAFDLAWTDILFGIIAPKTPEIDNSGTLWKLRRDGAEFGQ